MLMRLSLCTGLFLSGGLAGYGCSMRSDLGFFLTLISLFIGGIIATRLAWEQKS